MRNRKGKRISEASSGLLCSMAEAIEDFGPVRAHDVHLVSRCASFSSFQDNLCGATLDKPSFATCLFAACQTGSSVVLSPQAEACHAADRTASAALTRSGQSPPQHYHAYPIPTERRYWLKLADDRAVPSEIRNSGRMDSRRETEARRPAPNVIPIPVSVEEFSRIST